jgi:hypothetical protein
MPRKTRKVERFESCTVPRRKLQRKMTYNYVTGVTAPVSEAWVDGPCGAPLFGEQTKVGICRQCASGWTSPENYPIDPKES